MKTRNCHGIDCGDWESTGSEEMNELHDRAKRLSSILEIRDDLELLRDIITVCCEALRHSSIKDIKDIVSNILYFRVLEPLEQIEKELKDL